jgi:hypothetical protein
VAGLGDGSATLSEAISREFLSLYFGVQDPAVEGISKGVLNELAVTGTASPISIATGSAIAYGLYTNTAVVTKAISTPVVGTTGFRVVLQTNWAGVGGAGLEARTRIAVKVSADGVAAAPALTQIALTTWEISLATGTITTGGVITLTDARNFRKSTAMVDTAEMKADSVTDTILRNAAAVSVIGRAANSSGNPADIAAGANDRLLARVADALAFVQLTAGMFPAGVVPVGGLADGAVNTTAKLANDIVDDTKAGNRVPQFYRRQGSNAADWSQAGSTNYTPTAVRMQGGAAVSGAAAGLAITFPVAFSQVPVVLAIATGIVAFATVDLISATGCTISCWNTTPARVAPSFFWLAIGSE